MGSKSLSYWAIFAAGMALAAPVAAQTNGNPDSPAREVNPGQVDLNNFSLPGRVTRPAERPTEPAPTPREQAPAATTTPPPAAQPATRPATQGPASTAPAAAAPVRPDPSPTTVPGFGTDAQPAEPAPTPAQPPSSRSPSTPSIVLAPEESSGWSFLPFLAGLLALAGLGVIVYFVRQRRERPAFASAGGPAIDIVAPRAEAPSPAPTAPAPKPIAPRHDPTPRDEFTRGPPPPAPAPAPAPAAPVGIVSTALRPWIEVELEPDRAMVDDQGAAIAFNVTLFNSGAAPARDVSIEACLLNAGAAQDRDLGAFYAKPRPATDTIPIIPPQSRIPLRTAVRLSRDDIREYEVEGRKIFVPMVAVSTRYRWSSGEGQTGSSFLVGRGGADREKLGPFRIDQGNRQFGGLMAKRYEKGLRN